MSTKVMTAHVPLALARKVDQMAARLERPRGWVERHQLTLEALADVDAGRVIDHHAVQAWTASLKNKKPLLVSRQGNRLSLLQSLPRN